MNVYVGTTAAVVRNSAQVIRPCGNAPTPTNRVIRKPLWFLRQRVLVGLPPQLSFVMLPNPMYTLLVRAIPVTFRRKLRLRISHPWGAVNQFVRENCITHF